VGLRWAVRLIGLISTLLLARLLSPNDFGVVAMGMLAVGFFEVLSWNGHELAVVRHSSPDPDHYNSAWTISLFLGCGVGLAIFFSAPLFAAFFHQSSAGSVIRWLALRPFLSGLENVGTVEFQRSLKFDRIFAVNFYAKLVSFAVTIFAALALRNYWALVIGTLIGQAARTFFSYLLHPFRPQLCFRRMRELWSFSIWTFLRSVGAYLINQLDIIAIGGAHGSTAMGRYTVAKDVASSAVDEINEPVSAVLFPVMAKYRTQPTELRRLYLRTLAWACYIAVAAGVGICVVGQDLVPILLGQKWSDISPLIGWLALSAGVSALSNSAYTALDITGRPGLGARMQWIRVTILAVLLMPFALKGASLLAIAQVRFLATLLFIPTLLAAAGRALAFHVSDYLGIMWRPCLSGAVMAASLTAVNTLVPLSTGMRLISDIVLGAMFFSSVSILLWILSGRPSGPENDAVHLLQRARAASPGLL
jgi:lipopolysaccharide exporter